jgi:uncharacterized FAD-dependent dehydrogenase
VKYLLNNLRFPVDAHYDLCSEIRRKTGLPSDAFVLDRVLRLAVDTRRRGHPIYDASVILEIGSLPATIGDLSPYVGTKQTAVPSIKLPDPHPVIIGMGPAGLFCALAMVENGLRPRLYDRGEPIDTRARKVDEYWNGGDVDADSNVQFGEGGAGAFSDGKLTSRGRSAESAKVFDLMIRFGAPEEISYQALPHLGTDGVRNMVCGIRDYLKERGCSFHYQSRFEDLRIESGQVKAMKVNGEWSDAHTIVLATGNASRDTFRQLNTRGVHLEPKPFAIGFRIEQRQEDINLAIYGTGNWERILGPASYRLVDRASGCYTFCMCPGGYVIAAASEPATMVTNGMSFSSRDNDLCNSAIVCPLDLATYGADLFSGMEFQADLERRAFKQGGLAPSMDAEMFLKGMSALRTDLPSFRPGVYSGDFSTLFPASVAGKLKSALHKFEAIIKGFYRGAVLIAPETRTSSPLRVVREPNSLAAINVKGLYPAGEGSGYAGGIISSAVDGWKVGSGFKT